jgi:hypothetical protein
MRSGGLFPHSTDSSQQVMCADGQLIHLDHPSPITTEDSMGYPGIPPTIIEETFEERPAKRQKAKFPPVGRRLKPGPKPKAKTPRKGSASSQQTATSASGATPSFDPFVMAAQNLVMPGIFTDSTVANKDAVQQRAAATPSRSADQMQAEVICVEQGMMVAPSSVPKAVLETLYDCFLIQDESSATQLKRYRCNIDDCGREFPRKSAIHSHIQTHLEDKPFMCTEPDW